MTGALADLKQWVMDTGEPELEAKFRKLLGLMRRNGISDERVNAIMLWYANASAKNTKPANGLHLTVETLNHGYTDRPTTKKSDAGISGISRQYAVA